MEVTKTLKIKVHPETDGIKLSYLDKITAQMTYAVKEYLNVIGVSHAEVDLRELESYSPFFKYWTKLSTGFIQQCRDKAIWMWNSYIALLDKWEQSVARVKKKYSRDKKKLSYILKKLEKRKPTPPTQSKEYKSKKIPVFMDTRTCSLVVNPKNKKGVNLKLSKYWLKLSTLKKRHTVLIPLQVTEYHESRLKDAEVKSIQLVKEDNTYYAHIVLKYQVKDTYSPSKETCVIGVDLGIKKCAVSVALYPDKEVKKKDIKMFKDPRRRDQINKLTQMVGKLQKQDKWKILKQLRGKRANLIKEYDHIVSKEIAEYANELSKEYNVYVIVGYPKGIRNKAYKGNYKGNNFRGKVNRWSFKRILGFIQYKCNFYGIKAIGWNENGSSIKCSICGSKNTERSYQGLLKCLDCGYQGNADLNGAVNIGTDYAVKNIKKWIKKHKD